MGLGNRKLIPPGNTSSIPIFPRLFGSSTCTDFTKVLNLEEKVYAAREKKVNNLMQSVTSFIPDRPNPPCGNSNTGTAFSNEATRPAYEILSDERPGIH